MRDTDRGWVRAGTKLQNIQCIYSMVSFAVGFGCFQVLSSNQQTKLFCSPSSTVFCCCFVSTAHFPAWRSTINTAVSFVITLLRLVSKTFGFNCITMILNVVYWENLPGYKNTYTHRSYQLLLV